MKYIIAGTISPEWIARQKERLDSAKAKAAELGLKFEGIYYTQGVYDFVDIVEASAESDMVAFSIWYGRQGYGRITTMPAFSEAEMESAAAKSS